MSGLKNYIVRPDGLELGNAIEMAYISSSTGQYSLDSYFAEVKYNYKERYFLYGSLRGDGSSRFASYARWGLFGAVGGAWLISNEEFMSDVNLLRDFKFKASWGTMGNQEISDFLYTNWYATDNVAGEPGVTLEYIGNPELSWEKVNTFNVGFEFSLGKYFDAQLEYFYKTTTDMLFARYVAFLRSVTAILSLTTALS